MVRCDVRCYHVTCYIDDKTLIHLTSQTLQARSVDSILMCRQYSSIVYATVVLCKYLVLIVNQACMRGMKHIIGLYLWRPLARNASIKLPYRVPACSNEFIKTICTISLNIVFHLHTLYRRFTFLH